MPPSCARITPVHGTASGRWSSRLRVTAWVQRWAEEGYFPGSAPVSRTQAVRSARAQIPMRRFAEAEEIARAVLYLASADSSYVTGHLLLVDGGNTAR